MAGMLLTWTLIAVAIAFGFVLAIVSRSKTHEDLLKPILESCKLRYVSSKTAPLFRTGPFPTVDVRVGELEYAEVLGIDLKPKKTSCVRVVRFMRPDGTESESWARLNFYNGELSSVEWRPDLPDTDRLPRDDL
jgi:hypothetical protein